MGRFTSFEPSKDSSLPKRAALALIWLLNDQGDAAFVSWTDLFAAVEAVAPENVDPAEVKRRLRGRGGEMKAALRDAGYGWTRHPADMSMIRATARGLDTLQHCWMPYYHRRFTRSAEACIEWADKTIGDAAFLPCDKLTGPLVAQYRHASPLMQAALRAVGAVIEGPGVEGGVK